MICRMRWPVNWSSSSPESGNHSVTTMDLRRVLVVRVIDHDHVEHTRHRYSCLSQYFGTSHHIIGVGGKYLWKSLMPTCRGAVDRIISVVIAVNKFLLTNNDRVRRSGNASTKNDDDIIINVRLVDCIWSSLRLSRMSHVLAILLFSFKRCS